MTRSTALSVRARPVELTAASTDLVECLTGEAQCEAWRIVEVSTLSNLPFEVWIDWGAGQGAGHLVKVTASRAIRVCILARYIRVRAKDLRTSNSATANTIIATVADGFLATGNTWQFEGQQPAEATELLTDVPPFAKAVRVESSDAAAFSAGVIELLDVDGIVRSHHLISQQPGDGLPIAGTHAVRLSTMTAAPYRVVYFLTI